MLKSMANKVIALFVEGPTEIEFYKAVIKRAHDLMDAPFTCSFEWVDMSGIGNYKKDALRKFNYIKNKNPNKEIRVFMCIDSDAFEFSRKPPFNKKAVAAALKEAGAKQATYITARQSIEEWFLSDFEGILDFLRLAHTTKRPKGTGQESLKTLFKLANKVYVKGSKVEGFVNKLDISKIMTEHCTDIKTLCNTIGLDCKKVCNK